MSDSNYTMGIQVGLLGDCWGSDRLISDIGYLLNHENVGEPNERTIKRAWVSVKNAGFTMRITLPKFCLENFVLRKMIVDIHLVESDDNGYKFWKPPVFECAKSKERYVYLNMKVIDLVHNMIGDGEDAVKCKRYLPGSIMYKGLFEGDLKQWWEFVTMPVGEDEAIAEIKEGVIKVFMNYFPVTFRWLVKSEYGTAAEFDKKVRLYNKEVGK